LHPAAPAHLTAGLHTPTAMNYDISGPPVSESARSTVLILHLSALAGLATGIGFLLGPLVVWLLKKEEHPEVDIAGKDAVNFQLTLLVAGIVAAVLCITLIGLIIGIPLAIAVGLAAFVLPIIGAVKTANGDGFRYPFAYPFIK
jgi:uncharacterized Tic20 family protein